VFGFEVGVIGLVVSESNGALIIFEDRSGFFEFDVENFLKKRFDPHNFFGDVPRDLYSASVEDNERVGCFFDFQEMTFPLSRMRFPDTERLDSGHEAQSASA
jgi:hypothetical protein